jgi:hypothetical protein
MTNELRRTRSARLAILLPVALILVIAAGPSSASTGNGADEIDPQLQADLEAALRAKVGELLAAKDEAGKPYRRGSFSKSFRKVDDDTYQASFHQDTAGKDQVKTERLLLTLKKGDGVRWEIAEEEVKDTFTGLYRSVFGDEEFFTFESFSIEHEGMKISATNGSMVQDYYNGEVIGFVLFADDLKYDYEPPKDALDQYYSVYGYYLARSKSDFEFKPRHLTTLCDPVTCANVIETSFAGLKPSTVGAVDSKLQSPAIPPGQPVLRFPAPVGAGPPGSGDVPEQERRRHPADLGPQ